MSRAVSMCFTAMPSMWTAYPKILLQRRAAHVPDGQTVPPIEAHLAGLKIDPRRLQEYRRVCGFADHGQLPLTYPHVLAMPLHLAMLTADAFTVRLLGLVHVRNEILSRRPIAADARLDLHCRIAGHRDTDRGQEFDLCTELRDGADATWSETTTFLARRRARRGDGLGKTADQPLPESTAGAIRTTSWRCDADIGRRYAMVSGDFNPIHITGFMARLFGFDRTIAHGMWTLARSIADLTPRIESQALHLSASFKSPVLLPARVVLQNWDSAAGLAFALRAAQGARSHMTGVVNRL